MRKFLRKPVMAIRELPLPNLIENQLFSYKWLIEKGLRETFDEVSPITDYSGNLELCFGDYYLDKPKYNEHFSKERNVSYEAALRCQVKLEDKKTKKIIEQEVYLGDLPLITPRGTFIINGVERVVVSQLIRSSGVFFTKIDKVAGVFPGLFGAKIIPNRGAWLEIETDRSGVIWVRIDRKRKVAISSLLRAFGFGTDEELLKVFGNDIKPSLNKDLAKSQDEGLIEVYRHIRPGDLATVDNARSMIENMFFNFSRYDFGEVGRYKFNQRLGLGQERNFSSVELASPSGTGLGASDHNRPQAPRPGSDSPRAKNLFLSSPRSHRILHPQDLVLVVKEIIRLNKTAGAQPDDIDHLGNRRVRTVGELVQEKFRLGLMRMERNTKDKMSTFDQVDLKPSQLVNPRPIIASVRQFFASSQLSQFMDQVNPLAELEHKRRLSAMGPGGLARERAGFEVRDVHPSHYGRICPIQTSEGPNIGLVVYLSSYARINKYGFLETPYRRVKNGQVLDEIVYLDALEEEKFNIAHAGMSLDEKGRFIDKEVEVRIKSQPGLVSSSEVDYMDVSPQQAISMATCLIPFLEHDDAQRALMGSNMQRQAVSLIRPQSPIVGTGNENKAALDSGQVILAEEDGIVKEIDASHIIISSGTPNIISPGSPNIIPPGSPNIIFPGSPNLLGNQKANVQKPRTSSGIQEHVYNLHNFTRSNADTSINQKPRVNKGDKVKKGQLLADGASTDQGELALGQNILVAFMAWEGANYEDAIVISQRLVKNDTFSSVHIKEFPIDVRETKLGPEITTRDIPNVSEEKLKDLDEEGIIRLGAEVKARDILVGKITPKGEADLTPEERLLRAIFGEKAHDVKDSSLLLPHGEQGKVVGVKIFSRDQGDKLPAGVIQTIQVKVAQLRKVMVGDKLAGRHGNKGVIAKILPEEDMPYLTDGRPVDIILNPLGVVSRMNIGQILETHLGWAADALGYKISSPALCGINEEEIKQELKKAGLPEDGKVVLYDGRTGQAFIHPVTIGYIYIMKLNHLVEDKIHMRSIGPYSLITQQPLGGKAQFGGQRFGEMEVWALEGYGAAHILQEMLTIKSDDVIGRSKTYEALVKGEPIKKPSTPASFNVLVNELKALGLSVELK